MMISVSNKYEYKVKDYDKNWIEDLNHDTINFVLSSKNINIKFLHFLSFPQ